MYRNKPAALGTYLIAIGVSLLLASSALVIYNFLEDHQAQLNSNEVIRKLPIADEKKGEKGEDVPLYITNPDIEMPTIEIDRHRYIGRIDILPLGLSLPVMSEWSYPGLKISPCRYSGSAYENNLVIIAHNYRSHFGNLKNLNSGDFIVFTDIDGNVFQYIVAEIEQLQPSDTDKITTEDRALTLITCTMDGEHRVAVRCMAG